MSWQSRQAQTTSMLRRAIDGLGASMEGIDHRVGDVVEQRAEQLSDDPARELVVHAELDPGGMGPQHMKLPAGAKRPERSLDQAHRDRFAGAIDVLGRESLLDPLQADRELRGGDVLAPREDFARTAPWQELRIRLDVLD